MTQNFNAGDRVYSLHTGTKSFRVYTVTKVYKNGNFTVDDGKQQFRQSGYACGDSYRHVAVLTDEKLAELETKRAAYERHRDFRLAADKLSRMSWEKPVSRDQLDRIVCLVLELLP